MKSTSPLLLSSICFCIASCGTEAPSIEVAKAISYSPGPGRAFLYVYRKSNPLEAGYVSHLAIDGRLRGRLSSGKFVMVEMVSGRHLVAAGGRVLVLDMKGQNCYYIKQTIGSTEGNGHTMLGYTMVPALDFFVEASLVDQAAGRKDLNLCTQIASINESLPDIEIIRE